jgi:hypothetical protein
VSGFEHATHLSSTIGLRKTPSVVSHARLSIDAMEPRLNIQTGGARRQFIAGD